MSNNIGLANNSESIKHGTLIVATSPFTNSFQTLNNNVYHKPSINEIENKYDERFDDVTYYTIGNSTLIGA